MVHRMNVVRNKIHRDILPLVTCGLNSFRHRYPRSHSSSLIQKLQTSLGAGQTCHLGRKVHLNYLINRVVQTMLRKPLSASSLWKSQNPIEPDPDERVVGLRSTMAAHQNHDDELWSMSQLELYLLKACWAFNL
ncbi:hypothetical protein MRX96_022471 [Rhipicephalus microplus]